MQRRSFQKYQTKLFSMSHEWILKINASWIPNDHSVKRTQYKLKQAMNLKFLFCPNKSPNESKMDYKPTALWKTSGPQKGNKKSPKGFQQYPIQTLLKVRQDFFKSMFPPSKKRRKKILLYYHDTSGRLVFVCLVFLEEIEDIKKTFRN